MGLCGSSHEFALGPQTVLVMGADGSGRRTLVKQMRVILGRFDEAERREHVRLIHRLLTRHMRRAIQRAESKGALRSEVEDSARYVAEKLSESIAIDGRGADHLAVLWDDTFLKHAVQNADPAMSHLFDKLDDVVTSGYVPSDLDLMHVGAVTQGFPMRHRIAYARAVHAHILGLVRARVSAAGSAIPEEMRQRAELFLSVVQPDDPIDLELAGHIRSLWRTAAFRNAVVGDNGARFFERIRDIGQAGWVPTDEDIVYVADGKLDRREYSYYSAETDLTWNFRVYQPTDGEAADTGPGGQAAGASAVVFLVDMSSYRPDPEAGGEVPLLKALAEFERLLTTPPFEALPIFLVFTKRDLLALHLAKTPLTVCFPDYEERIDGVISSSAEEAAVQYIMDRFQEKEAAMQLVSHHAITMTDTDAANSVWGATQDVILRVAYQKQR